MHVDSLADPALAEVKTLQESNIVDPFGLFSSNVAILYTGIYCCKPEKVAKKADVGVGAANEPSPPRTKIGMIGLIYEIGYLRKLIDSSLEGCRYDPATKKCDGVEHDAAARKTRYLLYDHN